jgi:hypothetical protein
MNYRPICDFWILGRCKHKYFGGYLAGFLERARVLLGVGLEDAIAHIPGGMAHQYNGKKGGITLSGFGVNDWTIDLDPACNPDILMDVRLLDKIETKKLISLRTGKILTRPSAILIDRPYSEDMAKNYSVGSEVLPNLNKLTSDSLRLLEKGQRVGVIDWKWPRVDNKLGKEVAVIAVTTGRDSAPRQFTVFEKR